VMSIDAMEEIAKARKSGLKFLIFHFLVCWEVLHDRSSQLQFTPLWIESNKHIKESVAYRVVHTA
jgi:hypothetical protein